MRPMKVILGFTKEQLRCQGVYAIAHKATGRVYIGETRSSFAGRFAEHMALLNRNAHHCSLLQQDWNEFGSDAFAFRILDLAPRALTYAHYDWRTYLERKRILEAPLIYNSRLAPLPTVPPYPNPYITPGDLFDHTPD